MASELVKDEAVQVAIILNEEEEWQKWVSINDALTLSMAQL
jgi:hypothetical protein